MGKGKSDLALPLGELEEYGGRLRSLKARLNHTKKLFESYKDDIGDGSVNDALDDFESNWEDGREDISQSFDALADMSDAVVREFKKLDLDLAKKAEDAVKQEDRAGSKETAASDPPASHAAPNRVASPWSRAGSRGSPPGSVTSYERSRKRWRSVESKRTAAMPSGARSSTIVWVSPHGRTWTLPRPAGFPRPSSRSPRAKVHVTSSPSNEIQAGKTRCTARGSSEA